MKINENFEKIIHYILAAIIVFGFFIVLNIILWKDINFDNILTGALVAAFTQVVNYFFGSSKGSADKTKLITKNGEKQDG